MSAIVWDLIGFGWVVFYWVTFGVWAGYLGTLILEVRRHWKCRNDFRAVGEGDVLIPAISVLILAVWSVLLISVAFDTISLTSQIPNPIWAAIVLFGTGLFLGWLVAYERFLSPARKFSR